MAKRQRGAKGKRWVPSFPIYSDDKAPGTPTTPNDGREEPDSQN